MQDHRTAAVPKTKGQTARNIWLSSTLLKKGSFPSALTVWSRCLKISKLTQGRSDFGLQVWGFHEQDTVVSTGRTGFAVSCTHEDTAKHYVRLPVLGLNVLERKKCKKMTSHTQNQCSSHKVHLKMHGHLRWASSTPSETANPHLLPPVCSAAKGSDVQKQHSQDCKGNPSFFFFFFFSSLD